MFEKFLGTLDDRVTPFRVLEMEDFEQPWRVLFIRVRAQLQSVAETPAIQNTVQFGPNDDTPNSTEDVEFDRCVYEVLHAANLDDILLRSTHIRNKAW